MRRLTGRESLGALAGVIVTGGFAAWGSHASTPVPASPAAVSAPATSQGIIPATGTAVMALTGSCSLGWVAPFMSGMLPNTPAGYQQAQAAGNGMPSVSYYPGYTADATNQTGAAVVVTSVTVGQSFPGGADEPPVSFTPNGGPRLVEPGQPISLDGYFTDGTVEGGGQLFTVPEQTFEAGTCTAQFTIGDTP